MVSRTSMPSLLLISVALLSTLVAAATAPTKCYYLDGSTDQNAGYRCNNATTGNSACCAAGAVCYSNGVCQQSNDGVQDYLRVGCTDSSWQDPACLDQCTIYANFSTAGIRFCNGAITSTNHYCCDPGGNGIGSFACCDDSSDIFAINPVATFLAQIPLTYTSSSTSSSSTSASSTSSASSSSTTSTAPPASTTSTAPTFTPAASRKSSNNSAAIGAGVGVPLGVLLLAGVAFLWWRHRRNVKKHQAIELENNGVGYGGQYTDHNGPLPMRAEGSTLGIVGRKKKYFGGRGHDPPPQELAQPPAELPAPRGVHELGTDGARGL